MTPTTTFPGSQTELKESMQRRTEENLRVGPLLFKAIQRLQTQLSIITYLRQVVTEGSEETRHAGADFVPSVNALITRISLLVPTYSPNMRDGQVALDEINAIVEESQTLIIAHQHLFPKELLAASDDA